MINEQKIIYMETEGWGVVSDFREIIDTGDTYNFNGSIVYSLNFTDSANWLDSNLNFAYVGSTFVITNPDGEKGRYMCIGEDSDAGLYLFVFVDGIDVGLALGDFIRLEDNYKICTRVPDWVTGEDAKKRWMPIISDLTSTLSTQIKPDGGFSPTSGLTISCVHDLQYGAYRKGSRTYPRIETMLLQDSAVNLLTEEDADGEVISYQNNTAVLRDDLTAIIPSINSVNLDDYVLSNLTGDEYVEIPFFNSEAITLLNRFASESYSIERAVNNTVRLTHPIGSVLFQRLPTFQGANVIIFETNNTQFPRWTTLYFGMVENLVFAERLTGFDIEISSNLFTPRVSSLERRTPTTIERSKTLEEEATRGLTESFTPENIAFPAMPTEISTFLSEGRFYGRFKALQNNPEDTYSWVRIGNVAFKMVKTYLPFNNNLPNLTADNIIKAYGFQVEESLREQYVLEQKITGRTWVTYFVPPFIIDRSVAGAYVYPYERWNTDYDNTNLIQLDNLQQDKISEFERDFVDIRRGRNYNADWRDRLDDLGPDYLSKEPVSLIHVFEKSGQANSPADLFLGLVYAGNPDSEDIRGYWVRVHVVDIILQILTSTGGGGKNGLFDRIPSELSFAISENRLDLTTFRAVARRNPTLTVSNCYLDVQRQDPANFLSDLLKDNFLALSQGYDGKLRLVDLTALEVDPSNVAVDYTDLVATSKGSTNFDIDLNYEAINIANTIGLTWKEPWTAPGTRFRKMTAEISPSLTISATGQPLASVANIYDKIKARPISFDFKYAPVGNSSLTNLPNYPVAPEPIPLIARGGKYLSLYKKPIPIISINFIIDENLPILETGNLFRLTGLELVGVDGNVLGRTDFITCFVTDAQYDYLGKVCLVKAYILSFVNPPSISRWHIAGRINEVIFAAPDYELFIDEEFGVSTVNDIYLESDAPNFQRDIQQFSVGDTLVLLDENWVEKTTFVVDSKDDFNSQINSDDPALSVAVAGDIVMANLVGSVNTIYAPSLIGVNSLRINR